MRLIPGLTRKLRVWQETIGQRSWREPLFRSHEPRLLKRQCTIQNQNKQAGDRDTGRSFQTLRGVASPSKAHEFERVSMNHGVSPGVFTRPQTIVELRGVFIGTRSYARNSLSFPKHQVRGLATEPWSHVAKMDTKDLHDEHERELQRLQVLLEEVKSAYPQEPSALVGDMRIRATATLYTASKLVENLSAQLQRSSDTLLSFEQLAEVYRTHESLLDMSFGLGVAVPVEAFPPGMVPEPEREKPRRLTKRDRVLAEQQAESALQERIFRELYGHKTVAAQEAGSGGYAQWHEESTDPRTLLRGFHTVLLEMRRVAKVTKGSTRLSYRAVVCIGNGKGVGGYGDGKARTIQGAVARATREARRNLIYVPLHQQRTVPHAVTARFGRCLVYLWPLKSNVGLRMNYFYRCALDIIGVKDAGAKLHGSRNRMNAMKALFEALKRLQDPAEMAISRGYRVLDLSAYIEGKLQTALLAR